MGVIEGGTRSMWSAPARCDVGIRVKMHAEANRVARALARLEPRREGASIEIEDGLLRPAMEPTDATAALARQATALARGPGFGLGSGHAGGASDGCHCAAAGAPVLDGLGAVGGGAHADGEHVLLSELPRRIAFLVRLLKTAAVAEAARDAR